MLYSGIKTLTQLTAFLSDGSRLSLSYPCVVMALWLLLLPFFKVTQTILLAAVGGQAWPIMETKHIKQNDSAAAGNHHQTLQFETPKGILSVQRLLEDTNGHPLMQLTLPSSKCSKTLPSGLNLDPRTLKVGCKARLHGVHTALSSCDVLILCHSHVHASSFS